MLKEWEKSEKPSEEEIKARLEAVKEKLARQQLLIKEKKYRFLLCLKAGERPEKVMQSARSSRILIRVSLRWYRCRKRRRMTRENRFCTGILPKFRKPDSLYFWIRHGWMRLRRSVCTEPFPRMYMPIGLKVSAGLNGSLQTMAIWS